jgi:hypothetical protein
MGTIIPKEGLKMDKLVVQMGNHTTHTPAHDEEALVIRWVNDNIFYAVAREGIALVNVVDGRYVSTHLMPWSYADWIQRNWGIEVSEWMREQARTLRKF